MDLDDQRDHTARQPYVGLRPYQTSECGLFFGRANEARMILSLWTRNSVTLLHGLAGVGKTSLVQAGAIPLADRARYDVLSIGRVSDKSAFPRAALFEQNVYTNALLSSWAPTGVRSQLSRMTISSFLERRRRGRTDMLPVLAVIDQFEEIFQGSARRQLDRSQFIDALNEALRRCPWLHLLIIVREEYRADLEKGAAHLVPDAELGISPLSRSAAIDAVQLPATEAGRTFSGDAAGFLVDELLRIGSDTFSPPLTNTQAKEVLPTYLQAVCVCLWEALPDDLSVITIADVKTHLDADRCLSVLICRALIRVSRRYDLEAKQLTSWIIRKLVSETGSLLSVTIDSSDESIATRLLWALEDYHILRIYRQTDSLRRIKLQSKRLIRPLQLAEKTIESMSATAVNTADYDYYISDVKNSFSVGDIDVADRLANEALKLLPADDLCHRADMLTVLGNIAFVRGDTSKARGLYMTAAALFDAMQDHQAVGQLLAAVGQLQMVDREIAAAAATLQSASDRLPTDSGVKVELARAFAKAGEPYAAVAVLESVLTTSAEEGGGDARMLRGEILSDLGDSTRALRDLEELPPTPTPSVRAARALTLARLGRLSDAENGIEEALGMARDSGPVLLRAAQIRVLQGDEAGAADLVRQALKAGHPTLSEYQRRQADLLRDDYAQR